MLEQVLAVGPRHRRGGQGLRGGASAKWFTALGAGEHRLVPPARPLTWRLLDGVVDVTMAAIALRLPLS